MQFISHGQWGHAAFLRAYNTLPAPAADRPAMLARWLDVSTGTVRAWITGRRPPPRAACYATWLESAAGREAMHTQLFNEARTHAAHARSLHDAIAAQQRTIDALRRELASVKQSSIRPGAANDGAFSDFQRPAPGYLV